MTRAMILAVNLMAVTLAACGEGETKAADAPAPAASAEAAQPLFVWSDMATVRAVQAPAVRSFVATLDEDCANAAFGDEGVAQTDFNADGQPDFLLYSSSLICGGEPVGYMYCGSGGCGHDLLVSSGSDYVVRGIRSTDVEIVSHEGRPAVREPLEGEAVRLLAWDGSQMAEVQTEEAVARGQDVADIRRVIDRIYAPYAYDPDRGGPRPEYVEPSTLQTEAFNRAIAEGADPDGGLGYDPYCACQDFYDVTYSIDRVELEGDEATALVLFRNAGGEPSRFFLLMRRTPAGWRVDDITDEGGSLRAALRD